jgi:glucosamine 6-phosphate synthetase-like amidotransferase/phosphosugar isomerase protein
MCGINSSLINFNTRKFQLKRKINEIEYFLKNKKYNKILKTILEFRNNYIFIQIIVKKNKEIISFLKNILNKTERLKKKNLSFQKMDILNDIGWAINKEILIKSIEIENNLKKQNINISEKSVIFFRYLLYEIESLNYLESRGRDSSSISLTFVSLSRLKITNTTNNNRSNISILCAKNKKNFFSTNITVKYANRIGYAGENTKKLLDIIYQSKIFSKINFYTIISCSIIAHTRWASVGPVNLNNAHPLINKHNNNFEFFYMNGDITNYSNLKQKQIYNKNFITTDKMCSNDLQCLPGIFKTSKKKLLKIADGSFVIFYNNLNFPYDFNIFKKGTQGLYYSIDYDHNINFASDVYGLINKSNKFFIIKNNCAFSVNQKFIKKTISTKKKFNISNLSTRDLNKGSFSTYFLKEINDTELFLKRTILKYIDFKKKKNKKIYGSFSISKRIVDKLKNKKIKNIIFTGMGSCYTAAVGISKYLLINLPLTVRNKIKIQATLASEGSGFYLAKNMSDTIIIVLAQSGTTIDTNVYAKLARKRGAYTMAIVNKKDGDVTYIVQKSMYLGNGRDIELSVPSTKTYTCHLILGFIFAEQLISFLSRKDTRLIHNLKNIIQKNFIIKNINRLKSQIKEIKPNILQYHNWIVLHDDSINSFSALELRIKLSECCYRAIPYYTINQYNDMKINNCLVFYIGFKKYPKIKYKKRNYYIFISNESGFSKDKNIKIVKLLSKNFVPLIVETSLALQLLAYEIACKIDFYSKFINIGNKKLISFVINKHEMNIFNKHSSKYKSKILTDKFKRPIDTIKHQAKTVTVGAIRENINLRIDNKIYYRETNRTNKSDNFLSLYDKLKSQINLISDGVNELEKYFISNILELCGSIYSKQKFYNFIDLNQIKLVNKKIFSNLIFLDKSNNEFHNNLNNNIYFNDPKKLNYHQLIKTFLRNDNCSKNFEIKFFNSKKYLLENRNKYQLNLKKYVKEFNNIKFLGSGINYLIAKKYAHYFTKKYDRSIAFDIIENHKHIDISSESLLIVLGSNIYRSGFQNDIYFEIEKFLAHDNKTLIFTNIGNNIFDHIGEGFNNNKLSKIIKMPLVEEIYSPSLFDFYFSNFVT